MLQLLFAVTCFEMYTSRVNNMVFCKQEISGLSLCVLYLEYIANITSIWQIFAENRVARFIGEGDKAKKRDTTYRISITQVNQEVNSV